MDKDHTPIRLTVLGFADRRLRRPRAHRGTKKDVCAGRLPRASYLIQRCRDIPLGPMAPNNSVFGFGMAVM